MDFLAKRGVVVAFLCGSFLNTSHRSTNLLISIGLKIQEADAEFFEFPNSAEDGSPGASGSSKTCPVYPMTSV